MLKIKGNGFTVVFHTKVLPSYFTNLLTVPLLSPIFHMAVVVLARVHCQLIFNLVFFGNCLCKDFISKVLAPKLVLKRVNMSLPRGLRVVLFLLYWCHLIVNVSSVDYLIELALVWPFARKVGCSQYYFNQCSTYAETKWWFLLAKCLKNTCGRVTF